MILSNSTLDNTLDSLSLSDLCLLSDKIKDEFGIYNLEDLLPINLYDPSKYLFVFNLKLYYILKLLQIPSVVTFKGILVTSPTLMSKLILFRRDLVEFICEVLSIAPKDVSEELTSL